MDSIKKCPNCFNEQTDLEMSQCKICREVDSLITIPKFAASIFEPLFKSDIVLFSAKINKGNKNSNFDYFAQYYTADTKRAESFLLWCAGKNSNIKNITDCLGVVYKKYYHNGMVYNTLILYSKSGDYEVLNNMVLTLLDRYNEHTKYKINKTQVKSKPKRKTFIVKKGKKLLNHGVCNLTKLKDNDTKIK